MRTLLAAAVLLGCSFCLLSDLSAEPPPDAVPMVRFFDRRTNEHCYSVLADEQARWRELAPVMRQQYALGLVARTRGDGKVRLYRHLPIGKGRTVYSFSANYGPNYKSDSANFEVYVWDSPGDGRIPIYCSTWTDGTDLFLEKNLAAVERYSTNTKEQNGVVRLRPFTGPMFYIYPVYAQAAGGQVAAQGAADASQAAMAAAAEPSPPTAASSPAPSPATSLAASSASAKPNRAAADQSPPSTELGSALASAQSLAAIVPTTAAGAKDAPPASATKESATREDTAKESAKDEGAAKEIAGSDDSAEQPLPEVPEEIVVEFDELPLESGATCFDMTEDGKFLVISHFAEDRVSVYDVLQAKVVSSLKCPAPRSVMCRGKWAFVANYGHGTISVFHRDDKYRMVDRLQVEKPNILHISAPMGARFANELIVTSQGKNAHPSYSDTHVYVVETRKDRFRRVGGDALASVSADGKVIITQGTYHLSNAGDIRAYNYKAFTGGERGDALYGGGGPSYTPFVYQVFPSNYWLSARAILGGVPIGVAYDDGSSMIIPDYSQRLIYTASEDVVKSHSVAKGFPYLEMRRARYPAKYVDFSKVNQHFYRTQAYVLDHPTAYVHDRQLHMFIMTGEGGNGAILRAVTPAFRNSLTTAAPDSSVVASDAANDEGNKPDAEGMPARGADSASGRALEKNADANSDAASLDGLSVEEQLKRNFPTLIPAGEKFVFRFKLAKPGQFELMSPIAGAALSAEGNFLWRVAADQIGKHDLKIRVTQGDDVTIEWLTVEVVDEQLAKAAGSDAANLKSFQRLDLEPDHYFLTSTLKSGKMLLLQGDVLTLLAGDGFQVERKFQLPNRYKYVFDRGSYLTALGIEDGIKVDIIDKVSMKVKRSIDLKTANPRIANVTDIAVNPMRPVAYVAVDCRDTMPQYNVLRVDEVGGEAETTDIFGNWVQVSPDGRQLFTGYHDLYRRGTKFHINPDWRIIDIPTYGNIDMLLRWDADGQGKLRQAIDKPGTNGQGLRLSPDGRQVVYLSFTGDLDAHGTLRGWNTTDFSKPSVEFPLKDRGSTSELAYHPWLPMVASPGGASAILLNQDNGEEIENKLMLPTTGLDGAKVERLMFSADGKHLLFICVGSDGRHIRSVNLRLAPTELTAKLRGPLRSKDALAANSSPEDRRAKPAAAIPLNQIHALQRTARAPTLTPKEIGKRYLDSVVSILTKSGGGSGFFVSKSGYLVTSAHVVGNADKAKIIHNANPGGPFKAMESPAEVLCADENLDIALLKITLDRPTPHVLLSAESRVDTGEAVIVIGSPGLGEALLDRTMTEGIVSNPQRMIGGLPYIQTSAAVNPGNSGGPMFDSRGRVIGLVNLKGSIEGAGFATPASAIEGFLRAAAGAK